jgi:hypothetical protein
LLSDIYLARVSREIVKEKGELLLKGDATVLRFADDILGLWGNEEDFSWLKIELEKKCLTLKFTEELPENGKLKFLDVVWGAEDHFCWEYSPREGKPILSFKSNHSRVVKNGILKGTLISTCKKSCSHKLKEAVKKQMKRLKAAQFPKRVIEEQTKLVIKWMVEGKQERERTESTTIVIPYYHTISHKLKKIAARFDIKVIFSFKHKIAKLAKVIGRRREKCPTAKSKHMQFVECATACVYQLPLTCKKVYIGQTSKCVNERLTQHEANLKSKKPQSSNILEHIKSCECKTLPEATVVRGARSTDKLERELWEAFLIKYEGSKAISAPSLNLHEIEYKALKADYEASKRNRR